LPEGVNRRLTDYAQAAGVALPEGVTKRLTAYALAAGAAVGVLALATPAEADIIATSVNFTISVLSVTPKTLTIAGSHALKFLPMFFCTPGWSIRVKGLGGAQVLSGAAVLGKGAPIGSGKPFASSAVVAGIFYSMPVGNWDGKQGYLGFKFPSNGKNEFGWAKMSCSISGENCGLTEFAYDTVPGQAISARQTSAIPEPGTLSLRALGAAGLAVLRKRKLSAVSRQGSATG
jgi:hypothetical protein